MVVVRAQYSMQQGLRHGVVLPQGERAQIGNGKRVEEWASDSIVGGGILGCSSQLRGLKISGQLL
jgi:hypothetical protein